MASRNTKDTLQWFEVDIILVTSEEDGTQIMEVLHLMFRTRNEVI